MLPCIQDTYNTSRDAVVGLFGSFVCNWLWTQDLRLETYATSLCSKCSVRSCTHTNTAWVCVAIMLFWLLPWGYSHFPWLLYMELLDVIAWQLRSFVKGVVLFCFLSLCQAFCSISLEKSFGCGVVKCIAVGISVVTYIYGVTSMELSDLWVRFEHTKKTALLSLYNTVVCYFISYLFWKRAFSNRYIK